MRNAHVALLLHKLGPEMFQKCVRVEGSRGLDVLSAQEL